MSKESRPCNFKIFTVLPMFFILYSLPLPTIAEGSVREIMQQEVTSLSGLYDFYAAHTAPYERRYFMQYAPDYLTKFGVSEAPLWLTLALDSALGSTYVPLNIAAVRCIGALKIEAFSDKLTNEFINSGKKPDLSLSFRLAVLESMKKFDPSQKMEENIGLLLKNFQQELILDADFSALMEATMLFGGKTYMPYLDKFDAKADEALSSNGQAPEKKKDIYRVKELITRAKKSISAKEGKNE